MIDGVKYVLGTYSYGKDVEITDRITTVEFDMKTKTATPIMKTGLHRLLTLLASIKEWTFRGLDVNDELITDQNIKVLPINEENVRILPLIYANKLAKIASELNGLGEEDEKN